ncbi:30S ribosomal protein S18 [Mycoplasma sp. SG1]|uniref:30S ribosomal protein S18 n=1 Tax=Mycoplasma sp. SG1 TaxID=2810348 RepID=UPI0020242A20|nr:30S ribosomal protein S18 [Mycoplasma sp. SG1]URM52864.1 30S ribosomal protein S18 [Mycoplasma sp. SG1]
MNKRFRKPKKKLPRRILERRKYKKCFLTLNKIEYIDYQNIKLLKRFLSSRGKILARSMTGTKGKPQRKLTIAIKRARHMALLPY